VLLSHYRISKSTVSLPGAESSIFVAGIAAVCFIYIEADIAAKQQNNQAKKHADDQPGEKIDKSVVLFRHEFVVSNCFYWFCYIKLG